TGKEWQGACQADHVVAAWLHTLSNLLIPHRNMTGRRVYHRYDSNFSRHTSMAGCCALIKQPYLKKRAELK
ncbi:MAG: hypothetical protein ACK4Z4_11955, partial [Ferrovibrio sp.]